MSKRSNAQLGLQSEALKAALERAIAGDDRTLRQLLSRFGGMPSPRPNLTLAAAFGEDAARYGARALPMLEAFAAEEADIDEKESFLPVAAAHGLASLLARGESEDKVWALLTPLAGDTRSPVRIGVVAALAQLATRGTSRGDWMVARFLGYFDIDEREDRWGALGVALEVIAEKRTLETVSLDAPLFELFDRVIDEMADAPRAAERSTARRRILIGLPDALAAAVGVFKQHLEWLEARCASVRHPEVRAVLDTTIERLRRRGRAESPQTLEALAKALEGSKKPPRDPTLIREGMRGRGKKQRKRGI